MRDLSQLLAQRQEADQEAVSSQTQQLLQQHAQSLSALSSAALATTKAAIQAQQRELASLLKTGIQTEKTHQQQLAQLHAQTLQRLRWLMLWPVLASVLLGLLLVAGAAGWSWWRLDQLDNQIQKITAQFCAAPAGRTACKP